jgi:hypothetical protein
MLSLKVLSVITAVTLVSNSFAAESPALAKLQGKWSGKRTTTDGQEAAATIEIKGEKLTFQAFGADKELRFMAKADVKAEMHGPFHVMKITNIEGGRSVGDLEPVNDDRSTIYILKDDTLTLASNFDKERENEKPRLEVYRRVETKASGTPADAAKLVGKWKMTAKMGDDERDYEINFAETDGKLSGTLVSPRSGEHKLKSVAFSDGKLSMELPRTIEGNDVIFLYTGQLKGSELSGDLTVKGYEDQFKGSWTAKR